jgi:hypothetical protein
MSETICKRSRFAGNSRKKSKQVERFGKIKQYSCRRQYLSGVFASEQIPKGTPALLIAGIRGNKSSFVTTNPSYKNIVCFGTSGDFIRCPVDDDDCDMEVQGSEMFNKISFDVQMAEHQGFWNLDLEAIYETDNDGGKWVDLVYCANTTIHKDDELLLPYSIFQEDMKLSYDAALIAHHSTLEIERF